MVNAGFPNLDVGSGAIGRTGTQTHPSRSQTSSKALQTEACMEHKFYLPGLRPVQV